MKIIAMLLCSFTLFAQGLGVGGGISYPTGKFEAGVNFGYSAAIALHAPVFGVNGVVYAAYGLWAEKTIEDPENGVKTEIEYRNFPLLFAGARKYLGRAYISIMGGIYPVDLRIKEIRGDEITEYHPETTQGALWPGVGYMLPFRGAQIDLGAGYLWSEDYAQVTFGVMVVL